MGKKGSRAKSVDFALLVLEYPFLFFSPRKLLNLFLEGAEGDRDEFLKTIDLADFLTFWT